MLTKISLENFQSHEHTQLALHPGLTVIAGRSDTGKTAIVRALRWLVFNESGSDAYRSRWSVGVRGDETRVTLEIDEHEITRARGASENYYMLNRRQYKAMGVEVPEDIRDVLSLSSVNFQAQMDSPFLLSDTGGSVAKYFYEMAHLAEVDKTSQILRTYHRRLGEAEKKALEQVERLDGEIRKYDPLDELSQCAVVLVDRASQCEEIKLQVSELTRHIETLAEIAHRRASCFPLEPVVGQVEKCLVVHGQVENSKTSLSRLVSHIEELEFVESSLIRTSEITDLSAKVEDMEDLCRTLSQLEKWLGQWEQAQSDGVDTWSHRERLCGTVMEQTRQLDALQAWIGEFTQADAIYVRVVEELRVLEEEWEVHMLETCPLCGK